MDLQFTLAIVDALNGGKETEQRMRGWMGWESRNGRRLRGVGARVLIALAARIDPDQGRAGGMPGPLTERAGA